MAKATLSARCAEDAKAGEEAVFAKGKRCLVILTGNICPRSRVDWRTEARVYEVRLVDITRP